MANDSEAGSTISDFTLGLVPLPDLFFSVFRLSYVAYFEIIMLDENSSVDLI